MPLLAVQNRGMSSLKFVSFTEIYSPCSPPLLTTCIVVGASNGPIFSLSCKQFQRFAQHVEASKAAEQVYHGQQHYSGRISVEAPGSITVKRCTKGCALEKLLGDLHRKR